MACEVDLPVDAELTPDDILTALRRAEVKFLAPRMKMLSTLSYAGIVGRRI